MLVSEQYQSMARDFWQGPPGANRTERTYRTNRRWRGKVRLHPGPLPSEGRGGISREGGRAQGGARFPASAELWRGDPLALGYFLSPFQDFGWGRGGTRPYLLD